MRLAKASPRRARGARANDAGARTERAVVKTRAARGPMKKRPKAAKKRTARGTANERPAVAKKRAAKKRAAGNRATKKRAARKPGPARAVPETAPKRGAPARRAGARRSTPKRAPRLPAVPKHAPRAMVSVRRAPKRVPLKLLPKVVPPAFPQAQDGSVKQKLVFGLLRARTAVMAAIHGLASGSGDQRLGEGKWTVRETVLHLIACDRLRLRDMEAALLGRRPPWFEHDPLTHARTNEDDIAPLRHLGWDEALRLLQATRQQLMDAIEGVPDHPSERWTAAHPFGELLMKLPIHDRHHADAIKRWRNERGA